MYKGTYIKLSTDFSAEHMHVHIIKAMFDKITLSITVNGEKMKTFPVYKPVTYLQMS